MREDSIALLSEFLLLNHLFKLESNAVLHTGPKHGSGSVANTLFHEALHDKPVQAGEFNRWGST